MRGNNAGIVRYHPGISRGQKSQLTLRKTAIRLSDEKLRRYLCNIAEPVNNSPQLRAP